MKKPTSRNTFIATSLVLSLTTITLGQGTASDYERAENLQKDLRNKVFKAKVEPHWFAGNTKFWYRNDLAEGKREFFLVDAEQGTREAAFDHARLAPLLSKATGKEVEKDKLPLSEIEFLNDGNTFRFRARNKRWEYNLADDTLHPDERPVAAKKPVRRRTSSRRGARFPQKNSPDGAWTARVKDHNLYIRKNASGKEFTLTTDGSAEHYYENRVYWSPDSQKIVALRRQAGEEHIVHFVESSPKDQLQPKLHSHSYRKPGDRIPHTKPCLFDIASRKEIPIDDALFDNPWQLKDIRWEKDSRRFTFLHNQRGHQVLRIVGVNVEDGKARAIINETSKTFIDYAYKQFTHYLDDTKEIIWMSERDGWNHLYLYDSQSGKVKNQITKGEWVVRGVDRVDDRNQQIWFRASGIDPDQDPYYIHHCRINFDGSNLVRLTEGNGTHAITFSPDKLHLIDTYSRVDLPPVTELRRSSDGKLVCNLEQADVSKLMKTDWKFPERFVAKARDGNTDIHGVIFRPTNYDPKNKYPVIEKIYAGPHGSFVPKPFRTYYDTLPLAELGFIVVQIDGMGTSNRSKAFHDVCWKNLGDSGFPDRILWIQAAAKKYPYMDISRVGIYGGSAGGQSSTRAMLAHGDFYKAAVSDCGCHDNRMDKIWWNELWMGWPIGPHYADQSNVTNAHKLQGNLFLIVGEMDRNVDPASTMQVVNALIKADKDFDLLVVPGGGHGIGGRYGIRRRRDFFVRHLLGVEPRS